jgi:hypothetical protein
MSQMAVASSEMLEELPSTFPNFRGYFLLGAFESTWGNQSIPF